MKYKWTYIGVFALVSFTPAIAQTNAADMTKTIALQQAQIDELKRGLAKINEDIQNGNIHCPHFQVIPRGADGQWHNLTFKIGNTTGESLNKHHGYNVTADYNTPGKHSLGSWTVLNSHSRVTSIVGGASAYPAANVQLELQWIGTTYDFQLQIRTPTLVTRNGTTDEIPDIRVCMQPLPARLNINNSFACPTCR